ncbi:MAG: nucleotide exchange factor GrpE [Eubacteriaceae bacterium]|jgi:molecular chaperone GrpE
MTEEQKNTQAQPEQDPGQQDQAKPVEELKEAAKADQVDTSAEAGDIQQEIDKAAEQEARLTEQMMRLQADFENYKKRSVREKQEIAQYTMEDFLTKLLPVIDNLERAEASADAGNLEAYKQGVDMVFKQLMQVLQDEGLKTVATDGVKFDPNFHHGVAVDQSPDHEDQDITDVFQKGYQYKDKVIRPAMVKVCQK